MFENILEQNALFSNLPRSKQISHFVSNHAIEAKGNSPKHPFHQVNRKSKAFGFLFLHTPNANCNTPFTCLNKLSGLFSE